MTEIYRTISLSRHNGDDTPQNYERAKLELFVRTLSVCLCFETTIFRSWLYYQSSKSLLC